MFLRKITLPLSLSVLLIGCASSDSSEWVARRNSVYNIEGRGAAANSGTRHYDPENYNTSSLDNSMKRRTSNHFADYDAPIYSYNTTSLDNALRPIDQRGEVTMREANKMSTIDSQGPGTYTSMYNQGNSTATSDETVDGRNVSNAAAIKAEAYNFVEIQFDPGSTGLTVAAKSSLDQVIAQAKSAGKLDEALILSWSDEELPSKDLKKLPKYQRDLANNRNKAVRDYVKSIQKIDVETYNMAAQPSTLSKWFNTRDTKLKNALTAAGLPTTADSPQYPSKASHSLILIKVE